MTKRILFTTLIVCISVCSNAQTFTEITEGGWGQGIKDSKPFFTDLTVVIVNEDLGLSWDTSWPASRITTIIEEYKKFVWLPPGNDR